MRTASQDSLSSHDTLLGNALQRGYDKDHRLPPPQTTVRSEDTCTVTRLRIAAAKTTNGATSSALLRCGMLYQRTADYSAHPLISFPSY